MRAVIAVGSNIDAAANIPAARSLLHRMGVRITAESIFKQTAPRGLQDQPDFTNGAWLVETPLDQVNLKQVLRAAEDDLGRIRDDPGGPRTIDLDLIVWEGRIVHEDYDRYDFVREAVDALEPAAVR